jgi:hypothetical protein
MHHIVSDGASMGLSSTSSRAPTPAGTRARAAGVQFGDYAAWERAAVGRRARARARLWRSAWPDRPRRDAGPGAARAARQRGACVAARARARTARARRALARSRDATTNHVLLAAWLALLVREPAASDVSHGHRELAAPAARARAAVGFFVQSLALRVDLGGDPSFAELVRRVRAAALAAHEHGGVPFDRVVRAPAARRAARRSCRPFFSHMKDAIRAPAFAGRARELGVRRPGRRALRARARAARERRRAARASSSTTSASRAERGRAPGRDYARLLAAAWPSPACASRSSRRCARARAPRRTTPPAARARAARPEAEHEPGHPLSPLQERAGGAPGRAALPLGDVADAAVHGELEPERCAPRSETLVQRHEILRTRFVCEAPAPRRDGGRARGAASFESLDWSAKTLVERERECRRARAALRALYPLDGSAPLRAALARVAPGEHVLVLAQSALAADWRGLWSLARELARPSRGDGAPTSRCSSPILASGCATCCEGEDAPAGSRLGAADLGAAAELRLPLEFDRGARPFALHELARELPPRLQQALQHARARRRIPAEALLCAAWQAWLARLCERDELVLGVRSPGRAFQGLELALGAFERALPVARAPGRSAPAC